MSFTCPRVCRNFLLAVSTPSRHLFAIHCRVSAPDFGARSMLAAAPIPSPTIKYAIVELPLLFGIVASCTLHWFFTTPLCEPPFRGCTLLTFGYMPRYMRKRSIPIYAIFGALSVPICTSGGFLPLLARGDSRRVFMTRSVTGQFSHSDKTVRQAGVFPSTCTEGPTNTLVHRQATALFTKVQRIAISGCDSAANIAMCFFLHRDRVRRRAGALGSACQLT
jgi:hypothetical protein